jgi:hypothetical protein
VPRLLQLIALVLVFTISGAPKWVAELVEDDCTEECSNESQCPEEGCDDCSIICSSCPRAQFFPPQSASFVPRLVGVSADAHEAGERVPTGPPPKGVFHPPRRAG